MFLKFRGELCGFALTAFSILASGTAVAGISVSSPANGSTTGSPVHFVASASSSHPISATRIYVDGKSVFTTGGGRLNTYVAIGRGQHYVVVQAWDSTGAVFKAPLRITVSGTAFNTSSTSTPSGSKTFSNIDTMGGWETCARCAGEGGTGPNVPHYVTYGVRSPSMDGASAQFTNAGTVAYSDAIWWKQLGGNSGASHFVYDLFFYVKNPSAAQALEFDVNQSTGGRKYIFGTQCGVNHDHQWDLWGNGRWNPTGIGCAIKAYSWNHLTAEFVRSNGVLNFVAVTLNGAKHYLNRKYGSIPWGGSEINVAFQMDQTSSHTTYSVWLDKVKLSVW